MRSSIGDLLLICRCLAKKEDLTITMANQWRLEKEALKVQLAKKQVETLRVRSDKVKQYLKIAYFG